MGVDHTLKFACEQKEHMRLFLVAHHNPQKVMSNVEKKAFQRAPHVDLFCAGFPCQPFSLAGRRQGILDDRGTVISHLIRHIKRRKPKCFLLENVEGLLSVHNETLQAILASLRFKCNGVSVYSVSLSLLNSKDYGVPQNRSRLYIVGCKSSCRKLKFKFPKTSKPVKLSSIVEATAPKLHIARFAQKQVGKGLATIRLKGGDPLRDLYAIDIGSTKPHPILEISPCLTADRCKKGGHYLSSLGRRMTISEMAKL